MQINPTQAWNLYREIATTIKQSNHQNKDVNRALQRLCQAVIIKYNLQDEVKPDLVYANNDLPPISIKQLNLSTARAMVDARIVEWENERQEYYKGMSDGGGSPNDGSGYTTKPAAYRPQVSIQECLKVDYFEIRNTAADALALFSRIDRCARDESERISRFKITFQIPREIDLALQRLHQAILQKYNVQRPDDVHFTTQIDTHKVESLRLYSIDSMLDAEVFVLRQGVSSSAKSLRQILNISRLNPLNIIWYQEAYWGKSRALWMFEHFINFDQELEALILQGEL